MPQPEDQVKHYVTTHPGNFRTMEVRLATGLGGSTVSSVLRRWMGEDPRLSRMTRGRWHYDGRGPVEIPIDVGTLLECTGHTDDGQAVLQDEKGRLFLARQTGITLNKTGG